MTTTIQHWLELTKKFNPNAFKSIKAFNGKPPKVVAIPLSGKDSELDTVSNEVYRFLINNKEVYVKISGVDKTAFLDRMDLKINLKYLTLEELTFVKMWLQDKDRFDKAKK
jgi:hypothetical protein